jgi:outer membrane protein insertion porin family
VVCLLCAWAVPTSAAPEDYAGLTVRGIYFEPASQPLSRDQLGVMVQIQPGDTYDRKKISQALERLYASLRYQTIEVDAQRQDGGVVLTFRTTPTFFTSRVDIKGVSEPPNESQMLRNTNLEPGTPFEEADLPQAATEITRTLRANGFYSPKVTWETARRESTEEVDVRFRVEAGTRARLTTPVFQGNLQRGQPQLIKTTHWRSLLPWRGWREVTESRVQKGLDLLRASYLDRDHLQARVSLDKLVFDRQANTVTPYLAIDAGPKVFVTTEGAKVGKGALRQLVPVFLERTVDRDLLTEAQRNLVYYFQSRGFFDVKVDFTQSRPNDKGEQNILFRIELGPRSRLTRVSIAGNEYFDEATLRERLQMIPATMVRYRRGLFSELMLREDIDTIVDLYTSNGFREVKVENRLTRASAEAGADVSVALKIVEGPQWKVGELEISGVDLRIYEEVRGLLAHLPGQPFSNANLVLDRDSVLGYYFNSGYPDAQFDYTIAPGVKPHTMRVTYRVTEGRRTFVRDVLILGLNRTKPSLVQKRIGVGPGDPLSQVSIVESQRRLYDLGIFSKVDVSVQNPEGKERNKYVLFDLREARIISLNFGFGAELTRIGGGSTALTAPAGSSAFSPRVSLGVSRLNLFGIGHTAGIQSRFSRIQQRILFNYFAPQIAGSRRLSMTLSTLGDISRDVNTFTSRRLESAMQVMQQVSRATTFQYRFIYRVVQVDEKTLKIDPKLIPILSQPVRVGVASATFLRDRRDDPLDSHRGDFTSVDFGLATGAFGSKTDYTRLLGRNASYHRVGRDLILARSLTFGWLHNLNDPAQQPVPLPERFFGGGSASHRGFPENQAGPRDPITGFPIGGNAVLFFGTELRFPVWGKTLGGVLFHDAGNVYTDMSRVSFRWHQPNQQTFDYMVHAAGLGVRYRTPIGPVRLDFAWAANSPRFVGCSGTLEQLMQGHGCAPSLQRVGRFQIHFSLGQTF